MIPLRIDPTKLISLGLVMMPPDDVILDLVAKTPGAENGDFDKIRSLIQLQILDRDNFRVRDSAILAPDELIKLMYLAKAVGSQSESIAAMIDKEFAGYKNKIKKPGGGSR